MSSDWVGCRVSLDCGGLGHFQGIISMVSLDDSSISLRNPFQNGLPCKFPAITLNGSDIQDLRILETKEEVALSESTEKSRSTVIVSEKKRAKPAPTKNGGKDERRTNSALDKRTGGFQPLMSYILENKQSRQSPKHGAEEFRGQPKGGTRTPNRRYKDEDCFSPSVFDINEDFDFEKNLALFDKHTILAEIDQEFANKPDIIRLVDCNRRPPEPKYKNDENILGNFVTEYRQIDTGEVMETEYVTDSGLVVPAISFQLRFRLQERLEDHGFGLSKQTELMGRAATELCLQLLGGQHRLAVNNTHQLPLAVFLCGTSRPAVFGLTAARHLAGHGVRTQVYLPETGTQSGILEQELRLYRLTGGKVVTKAKDLPKGSVDAVVTALEDEEMWSQQRIQPWHRAAVAWAEGLKAPVLSIDPPPELPALNPRMTLVSLLPLAHPAQCGNLYLANLGVPCNVFKEVGIKFASPFGAKFVIQLHSMQQ
ncbi:enhancer of mRNA-decapping protein 3 [Eurytemora carolleeae]|uniref:enhancer of mRNA-decapping protein 3 n=1 Tax=Eurytemora carolleeae TaxID=1294199 RepID=UPI000C75AFFB|nr:enhancer of mRNA-decapping protein 3 [Eurytemora carolleeae]|eukprot:XP_023341379.1 enhancer of mRNA-decapping protein 3-like [Eurytemora affinis]